MINAISDQQELITQQKEDLKRLCVNAKMNELVVILKKDLEDLDKSFNKTIEILANCFSKQVPLKEYTTVLQTRSLDV